MDDTGFGHRRRHLDDAADRALRTDGGGNRAGRHPVLHGGDDAVGSQDG
jgi:hypothetical protein